MEQFQDGYHVWLRSRVRGIYLRADKDGVGVSLHRRRASLKAAWAVHLYQGDDGVQYVLLRSAAYGRYLAATDDSAPLGLSGHRVALQNYDQPEAREIRWQAVRRGSEGDVMLRQVGTDRYLRANGKYLRWINGVSIDDPINISTMMQWVVEPIPLRQGMPDLPGPTRDRLPGDLSVIMFGRAAASFRVIRFVRAGDDGFYPEAQWADVLHFRGRSVHRLRHELAICLRVLELELDIIMCVRAGRYGRLTPLFVKLPRAHGDSRDTIEIVVIMNGTPASAALRHPDVDAE